MGGASEWLAYQYLKRRFPESVDEDSWISENRTKFFGRSEGDDSAGYDFLVQTPNVDWMFEVKSTLEDGCEFELTSNELRVASSASRTGRRRYRILYVPYVFCRTCAVHIPTPLRPAILPLSTGSVWRRPGSRSRRTSPARTLDGPME